MGSWNTANKLISFPRLDSDRVTAPVACASPAPDLEQAPGGRPTSLRHRGLHVMAPGATVKSVQRASGQAQADRIVAQVEWEIEQQAARQRERFANGPAEVLAAIPASAQNVAAQGLAAAAPIRMETPVTVARRLFALVAGPRTA